MNLLCSYVLYYDDFSVANYSQNTLFSVCFLCLNFTRAWDFTLMALIPRWSPESQCPSKAPDHPVEALGTLVLALPVYQLVYLKELGHIIL